MIRSAKQDMLSVDQEQIGLVHQWITIRAWHRHFGGRRRIDICERCGCKRQTIKSKRFGWDVRYYGLAIPAGDIHFSPDCFDPKILK